MEEVKCSGCKWFLQNSFCGSPKNIGLDSDCYEPEEKYYAATKIDRIRKEIDEYTNSKTKEEIEEEVNETESVFDQLHNYLENATQEQLDKDWEELKQYNEVGPDVVDFVEQNAYKAGYDAAMEEFKLFLYKCNFCSTSYHVYNLIEEKLKELEKDEK